MKQFSVYYFSLSNNFLPDLLTSSSAKLASIALTGGPKKRFKKILFEKKLDYSLLKDIERGFYGNLYSKMYPRISMGGLSVCLFIHRSVGPWCILHFSIPQFEPNDLETTCKQTKTCKNMLITCNTHANNMQHTRKQSAISSLQSNLVNLSLQFQLGHFLQMHLCLNLLVTP